MTQVDRFAGLVGNTAIKAPCRAASTVALTLSGEQTVDGVALVTGDRVIVKNQASSINNGIYVVDTGAWSRSADADGSRDFANGTLVMATGGTVGSGFWYVSGTDPITIGTDAIAFATASTYLAVISAFMQTTMGAASASALFDTYVANGTATTLLAKLTTAALSLTGDITPTTLAANTDDWAPTGFSTASTIRVQASSAVNLTGIASGTDGRIINLHNVGSYNITLIDDATSSSSSRFALRENYILSPDASVTLQYDSTSLRWRLFGQASAVTGRLLSDTIYGVKSSGGGAIFTVTIASPAVLTFANTSEVAAYHGMPFVPTTTGALPTGITATATYYLSAIAGSAFTWNLSASKDSGSTVTTTGSQSGTHKANNPTYNKATNNPTTVDIELYGGGGGGGGVAATAGATGSGGGGGAKTRYFGPATGIISGNVTLTVGAGGAAGAAGGSNGAAGENTTATILVGGYTLTASGGSLGTFGAANAPKLGGDGGDIVPPTTASYGVIQSTPGAQGGHTISTAAANTSYPGYGGASPFTGCRTGIGAAGATTAGRNGNAPTVSSSLISFNPGAGGSGAAGATANAGGDGAAGCIRIREYA